MKTAALALLLVLLALPAASADMPAATAPPMLADVPANAPTVTLTSPGKAPRRPIRFTATKGMRRAVTTTMKMKLGVEIGDRKAPVQKLPTIQMVMDLVVTDVASNGDIRYEFTLREPVVMPDKATPATMRDQVAASIQGLGGMTGHAVVTSRGFTRSADVAVPKSASAQSQQFVDSIRQSLNQLSAPVPAEPVGVGASWDTVSKLEQSGLALTQTATTRLKAFKGNRITLQIGLAQQAAPQKFTTNGVSVDLLAFASKGSGETTIELDRLLPELAKVAMHSDFTMDAAGQKMRMILDLAMMLK
ncbi:MAG: hypothetical protein H0X17_07420 [Deltaproteobacteria bacterium]|nr:hypothetical protein [Deltaproteobacteria bacterium]